MEFQGAVNHFLSPTHQDGISNQFSLPLRNVQEIPTLNGSPSPRELSWMMDFSNVSLRASSTTPSLSSAPSSSSKGSPPTSAKPLASSDALRIAKPRLPSMRQRTAQACDKCRERKTKCSGHHPVCLRCTQRGLTCHYSSREMRMRGVSGRQRSPEPPRIPHPPNYSQLGYRPNAFVTLGRSEDTYEPVALEFMSPYTAAPIHATAGVAGEDLRWIQARQMVDFPLARYMDHGLIPMDGPVDPNMDLNVELPLNYCYVGGVPPQSPAFDGLSELQPTYQHMEGLMEGIYVEPSRFQLARRTKHPDVYEPQIELMSPEDFMVQQHFLPPPNVEILQAHPSLHLPHGSDTYWGSNLVFPTSAEGYVH